jgi:hypothetical protein
VLERLFLAVVAVGPILAMLAGISMVAVALAWVVTKVLGPRKGG